MLSIIIPAYNEEKTIVQVVDSVRLAFNDIPHEIIIVNDGSTDRTNEICASLSGIIYIHKTNNEGKGSAIRSGFERVQGKFVAIQDADLEYEPKVLRELFNETKNNLVIYGKRDRKLGYILNRLGNSILSNTCNILYGSELFDIYTCYKIIPTDVLRSFKLSSNGFEIEAEITTKLLKKGIEIKEIPITYNPRTFKEGKHIRAKDAITGIWTLIKNRF